MSEEEPRGRWVKGLTHWREGETAYISVAFSWVLREAERLAEYYRAIGCTRVRAGGPGLFAFRYKILIARIEAQEREIAELRAERDALLQRPIDLAKMDSIDEDATDRMIAYYWYEQAQEARKALGGTNDRA